MPGRASERRAAERATQRDEHADERAAEREPPGRGFTPAQAAVAAVFLASLLWLVARLEVPAAPGVAPVTAEAPR
jgi:hypothetical protein